MFVIVFFESEGLVECVGFKEGDLIFEIGGWCIVILCDVILVLVVLLENVV